LPLFYGRQRAVLGLYGDKINCDWLTWTILTSDWIRGPLPHIQYFIYHLLSELSRVPHLNARIRSQRLDRAVIKKFIVVFLAYLLTIGVMRLSLIFIPKNVVDERQTTYVQKRILEYGKLLLLIEPALNPLLYPLLSSSGSFGSFYRDLKSNFKFKKSTNPYFLRKLNKTSSRQNEIALVNLT
jgi:hypothetical protein